MIFYFSGTGNSLWVAKQLSEVFKGKLVPIAEELKKPGSFSYQLSEEEKVFFVFPVHSWGPPVLISKFIEKLIFHNYNSQSVYLVCTCGDDCGYTNNIIKSLLKRKSIQLTASYSLIMPNNYILMRGFGVDSKEIETKKLSEAPKYLNEIIKMIQYNKGSKTEIYKKGGFPWVKSRIIYPLFSKFAIGSNSFYVTDKCIKCGLCVKICPTNTITLDKKNLPQWNKACVQCTACIHRCPVRAIEYGGITENIGRYVHPELK